MKINRNILKFISLIQLGIVIVFCCIYLGSKDKNKIVYYEKNDAWQSAFQTYDSYDIDLILKECENRIAKPEKIEYERDEWEKMRRHYDTYRNEYVGLRDYKLSLNTSCDITDSNVFTYKCPYSGFESNNYKDFEYDHIVPIAYAATHGGNEWSSFDKTKFYNDYENGICVSKKFNREKRASGPSEWLLEFN